MADLLANPETVAIMEALAKGQFNAPTPAYGTNTGVLSLLNQFGALATLHNTDRLRRGLQSAETSALTGEPEPRPSFLGGPPPAPVTRGAGIVPPVTGFVAPTAFTSLSTGTTSHSLSPEFDRYARAIDTIEAGGNYGLRGPLITRPTSMYRGDRAYGRFQVMGRDVPRLTRQFFGRELTPEQFLADPAAQNAVFQGEFGRLVQRFGNPIDAAQAWFAGESSVGARGALDRNDAQAGFAGTSVRDYRSRFSTALSRLAPTAGAVSPTVRRVPTLPIGPGGQANIPGIMRLGGPNENEGDTAAPTGPRLPSGPELAPERELFGSPGSGLFVGAPGAGRGVTVGASVSASALETPVTRSIPGVSVSAQFSTAQTVRPPQGVVDVVEQSIPGNPERIRQIERLRRIPMSEVRRDALNAEYIKLTEPTSVNLPNLGTARYVYDRQQGRYVLDSFQGSASVQTTSAEGLTMHGLYVYSRNRGWTIVPLSRSTTASSVSVAPGTSITGQPGAVGGIPQALLDDIDRRLTSGDVVGARAALDEYKRQSGSLASSQITQNTIRDTAVKDASVAPAQRTRLLAAREALARVSWTGPGAERVNAIRTFLANIGVSSQNELNRLGEQQLVELLQQQIGVGITRSLTSRPTQFDFQTLSAAAPGIAQSAVGARLMVNYMLQEVDHTIGLGRILARPTGRYAGKTPSEIAEMYHRANPIILDIPQHTHNGQTVQPHRLWTGSVETQEDYNDIPPGVSYRHPDGQVKTKPRS